MTLRGALLDQGYALGWAVVRRMPERSAAALFRRIADRAYARNGSGVRRLRTNYARVVPDATPAELEALTREGMRRYLRYWMEVFRLPSVPRERLAHLFQAVHEERIPQALATGRGVVMALPHMANWDLAGAWYTETYGPFTTVAERLKPEALFDRFVAYRESLGMEVLPLTGDTPPFRTLLTRLRAGGAVCLVADRDLSATGVVVDFFGEPARMPGGPALLAALTGATLIPVTMHHEGDHVVATFHPPLEVPREGTRDERVQATTQALANVFEAGIRRHPADWHMLQRVWVDDLEPKPVSA